jgi:hypothetical protein
MSVLKVTFVKLEHQQVLQAMTKAVEQVMSQLNSSLEVTLSTWETKAKRKTAARCV